ncbi:MAG: hypothetical protein HOD63_09675 [Bacteroidetes bacterium]|nr:hypothetical protein [Bacteroidota bacterium]MBT3801180.1 hypothetical protein [Bacteroidota bacterium]MBT3934969.1 hypothetical protein [Bacteroidota bacterium]MBT4338849.1 hypothetical protein [Bacteroidota bacterium]MBT6834678.1 response regulator [Bacteroidota bacterium]
MDRAINIGCKAFLSKPFQPNELVEKIASLLVCC